MDKFWSFWDNGGKIFSGLAKRQKMSAGTVYEKNFLKNRKYHFFFQLWAIFSLLAKTFARFAKPAIWVCVEVIGKNIFSNIYKLSHFFGLWSKKRLVGKFFHGLSQLQSAPPEAFLIKSNFSKKSYNCSSVLEFEHFFCLLTKKVRVSKKQPNNTEKKMEERICRKIVFYIIFGLPA